MSYPIARFLILALSFPLILLFMLKQIKKIRINISVFVAFIFFVFSSLISVLVNADSGSIINVMAIAYLYIFLAILFNSIEENQQLNLMRSSILSSHITILIISLVFFGGISVPFKGMFLNPNSMGQLLITISVVVSAIFYQLIYNKMFLNLKIKKSKLFWSFVLALIVLYLSILTKSRTSNLVVIIVYILPLVYIFFKSLRNLKNVTNLIVLFPFAAFAVWALIRYTGIFNLFNNLILSKFVIKSNDLTDGRSYVWKYTIDNTGLFGNGHYFFDNTVGAHNTFIDILGEYGWASLIFFIIFTLLTLINSLKYLKGNHDNRFVPFLMVVAFIATSMTEGQMFKPLMIGLFLVSGIPTLKPNSH
ncbi:hypothetical protein QP794_27200 [Paenibacillus sp. UMB7766-LJ446]|uniref:O-antigen ligase family protein n=1 Tax=Paenibacillus sp. UMB7766-LJ446 TaxID=3046313 RepID=UPI00254C503B|nr:hypothetical protein [Paenibacillus sp. UMB7766-LJ446]MDK8193774.1 hypothetical protein [Paenibacillus sp. UMB7766-LJ446]